MDDDHYKELIRKFYFFISANFEVEVDFELYIDFDRISKEDKKFSKFNNSLARINMSNKQNTSFIRVFHENLFYYLGKLNNYEMMWNKTKEILKRFEGIAEEILNAQKQSFSDIRDYEKLLSEEQIIYVKKYFNIDKKELFLMLYLGLFDVTKCTMLIKLSKLIDFYEKNYELKMFEI
jgi:hypothetical protein